MVNYTIYVLKDAVDRLEDLQKKAKDAEYAEERQIAEYMVEVLLAGSKMPPNIFKCTCGKVCTTKHGLRAHIHDIHIFQHEPILVGKRTVKVVDSLDSIQV